jgi:hypothetical protein
MCLESLQMVKESWFVPNNSKIIVTSFPLGSTENSKTSKILTLVENTLMISGLDPVLFLKEIFRIMIFVISS